MENKAKAIQDFEQFAKDRLNNHIAELNTPVRKWCNRDKQSLEKAYGEHEEIFRQELDEKIK